MKKLPLAMGVAALCALATGTAADAAGKKRHVVERFSSPYEFVVDCGAFGPYAFDNLVAGRQRVTVTDVVDSEGTLLETVLQIGFDETDTNSESGVSLPLRGSVHEVWDWQAGTRTLDGTVFVGTDRGEGTYVQDTGRITMPIDGGEPEFVAGPHEAFFAGGIDAVVCEELAEGG